MFIASVNAPCINAPFSGARIDAMHESMKRLLDFARQATAKLPAAQQVHSFADLGPRLNATSATLTNWKARGISKDGALDAEREFGCPAVWLLDGEGFAYWSGTHPLESAPTWTGGVSQLLRHHDFKVPPTLNWGDLMNDELPPVFTVAMPDDSMSSRVQIGKMLVFSTTMKPKPGSGVLVADRDDNLYFREYRQARPGAWQAHAYHSAYGELDSERDGLRVLAVLIGEDGPWA